MLSDRRKLFADGSSGVEKEVKGCFMHENVAGFMSETKFLSTLETLCVSNETTPFRATFSAQENHYDFLCRKLCFLAC